VRHPQLLIFQGDARMTALLEPAAEAARWWLRKPGDLAECLEVLPRGGPSVLVLRLGRDLEGELTALERVHRLFPDAAVVVVGDAEQASIAGIAWDLGARFVHFPPLDRDMLREVVAGLMGPNGADKA
jgi:DNA-binding NtrC family response regulator